MTSNTDNHLSNEDAIATSLERAGNLLATLGSMYNDGPDTFAVSNSYLMHTIVAVSEMLQAVQVAVRETWPSQAEEHQNSYVSEGEHPEDLPLAFAMESSYLSDADEAEQGNETTDLAFEPSDQFAKSYLDLLRKLTAAEIFAAEQQALAPPGTEQHLLPLLRNLREEFQKLNKVA